MTDSAVFDDLPIGQRYGDETATIMTDEYKQLHFDYFTEEHFNQKTHHLSSPVDMSVFHLNIRSLNANHRALCQYLQIGSLK